MESLSQIKPNLVEKFNNKSYFSRFFKGRSQDEIVTAIQDLRILRDNISQSQLAETCGMKPSAVCRLEKPEYGRWNFQTLWRIAEALDARWRFILEPRETVIASYRGRDLFSDVTPFSIASSRKSARQAVDDQGSHGKLFNFEQKDEQKGTTSHVQRIGMLG